MNHLEASKERYIRHPEQQFRWSVEMAWEKADKYYSLLDDTPVFIAAIVLNPRRGWQWIDKRWADRESWRTAARTAVNRLWSQYRTLPRDKVLPEAEAIVERDLNSLAAFKRDCDSSEDYVSPVADEYAFWIKRPIDHDFKSPITYWTAHRVKWPRLARIALDIFSVLAMSDELERIFSLAGCMVTDRRNRLKGDAIQAGQCLKNWYGVGLKRQ